MRFSRIGTVLLITVACNSTFAATATQTAAATSTKAAATASTQQVAAADTSTQTAADAPTQTVADAPAQTPANTPTQTQTDKPACCSVTTLNDGFYVGAKVGYDSYRIRQNLNGLFGFNFVTSYTGWVGGLFAGFGKYINNFYYLGGEIFGNYDGNTQTLAFINDNVGDIARQKMRVKTTFGLSFLPGLKLANNVLGFLRLGYDWTRFEVTNSGTDIDEAENFAGLGNNSSTRGGFHAGVGLETVLCNNWSVRGEYNHMWYGSGTFHTLGVANKYNASDNQFTAGVIYHLG